MYEPVGTGSNRKALQRNAIQGGVSLAGGIGLMILHGLAKVPFLGLGAGVAMAVFGYTMMTRKTGRRQGDTVQGAVLTAVGILTALTNLSLPILGGLSSFMLWGAGIGLIGYGIWNLIQFRKGTK